jgi:hypothetical protein
MNMRRGGSPRKKKALLAIAATLALVLVAGAGWARPLNDQETASLAATVEGFGAAVREGNDARIVQIAPPKYIGALARRTGATPDEVVAMIIKAQQQMFQEGGIKIESFRMELAGAGHKELASGTPYLLIPTQTIVSVAAQSFRQRSHTLALLEDGKWFLLQIADAPQLEFLLDAYPEFAGVEFPTGSVEALHP